MTQTTSAATAIDLYRRLLKYVKPYWVMFTIAVAAMLVFAATEAGLAAMMKPLVDGSFVERDPETIKWVPIALIGLFIVRGIVSFFTTYGIGWIARNVIKDLRTEMFAQLITLPARFYDQSTTGQLMSKLLYDVEQVASASTDAIVIIIRDTVTILALLAWMLYLSGTLSLIILTTVPAISILVYKVSTRFRRISKEIQDSMGDVGHISSEIIDGQREVKTFGSQHYEIKRF